MADENKFLTTKHESNETIEAYIERITKNKIIDFIHWDCIEIIEFLDKGGSGTITKAKWIKNNIMVALKVVTVDKETNSYSEEFIKEAFHKIGLECSNKVDEENREKMPLVGYENVIKFFGVSRGKCTDATYTLFVALYLIFEYADLGNLRCYLSQTNLNWEKKINIARQIACGLHFLHKNEILHRDLHTKNVVIQDNKDSIRAIITDFGLSKVLTRNSKSNQEIAGFVAFIDPKLLNNREDIADYKSDIYSLGVILWEITSDGRPPFKKYSTDQILSLIIAGDREEPIEGSTISYVDLYRNCWNENPDSRPVIEQVYQLIHNEGIITGEKLKQPSKSYISDKDQKTSEPNETKQIFNKLYETLDEFSPDELESIEQLDLDEIAHSVQAALTKKEWPFETNE
ncbi:kinase-like domain-containing protein [Gigaspora rosea]|uniref:Kinase-like domain-containing protein n=1 Tax=Gigaspora rosea TaxID=44941 RepID=A0A397W1B2_9GLOM|nr:kinase-like domain-containing protein [Gigaspora rosea]